MTSRSRNSLPSTVKRTSVRTLCQPCSPAHLCINSSVLGIEATAELIKDFAIKKLTAESK